MSNRIEEKLKESPLLCSIVKGVAYALAIAMCFIAVGAAIYAFAESSVWFIVFMICVLLCGASFGIAIYLD